MPYRSALAVVSLALALGGCVDLGGDSGPPTAAQISSDIGGREWTRNTSSFAPSPGAAPVGDANLQPWAAP